MTDIDKMCTESFKHGELDNYRKLETRGIICQIEKDLKSFPGAVEGDSSMCPLEHSFSDGIYTRKIFIPKGVFIVGKIHKHDHPNFLLEGEVSVLTEEGSKRIKAPCQMISPKGTKRVVYAHENTVWTTIHANPKNTQDLEELERDIIAKDYKELEQLNNLQLQEV